MVWLLTHTGLVSCVPVTTSVKALRSPVFPTKLKMTLVLVVTCDTYSTSKSLAGALTGGVIGPTGLVVAGPVLVGVMELLGAAVGFWLVVLATIGLLVVWFGLAVLVVATLVIFWFGLGVLLATLVAVALELF